MDFFRIKEKVLYIPAINRIGIYFGQIFSLSLSICKLNISTLTFLPIVECIVSNGLQTHFINFKSQSSSLYRHYDIIRKVKVENLNIQANPCSHVQPVYKLVLLVPDQQSSNHNLKSIWCCHNLKRRCSNHVIPAL